MKKNIILYLLAALLFIAVIITYSNHFHNAFHFDDSHTIVDNAYIRNIRNIPLFFKDGTTSSSLPMNQVYRPVVVTTLAIDYWLGSGIKDTLYFHLSTFVLFLFQGFLMYLLYLKVFNLSFRSEINPFIALFAAGWYLLHPANAETINYIIARSDTLSTLFVVLALVLFQYSSGARRWHLYLIPFAIALLAKPIAAVFILLLLSYVYLFENEKALRTGKKRASYQSPGVLGKILPSLIFGVALLVFIQKMNPKTWVPGGTSLFHYLITQPFVIVHYFTTFFLPLGLSADTDWKPLNSMADLRFFGGLLFVLGLCYIVFVTSKKERLRPIAFGILWFFIALFPTSSIFPLAEVMNDHRIFFPYVGLAMSVSWTAALLFLKLRDSISVNRQALSAAAVVLIGIILSAYAFGTHERNKVWRTEESLWLDVTEKSPRNGRGLMNYGLELMAKADYAGAEKYFMRALEFTPQYSYLHVNIAILKAATGRPAEAEQYFKNALSAGPDFPGRYFFYARFLREQQRYDEAILNLNRALAMTPGHLDARHMLMSLYLKLGNFSKVKEIAEDTLRIAPDDRDAALFLASAESGRPSLAPDQLSVKEAKTPEDFLNLSLQYYNSGQYQKSIRAAGEALKLRPDYDPAYNNLCAAYNELKQWDKAIEAGKKAVQLNPNNQLARNNLAWAEKQKKLSLSPDKKH